jgi:hypothetical protein
MKHAVILAAVLLTGCNQGATVTKTPDGGVTVEKDGATIAVNTKDCARASFVPLYADAKVTTCVASKDGDKRGTIIYTSAATPATVLAWYKAEAEKAGLKVRISDGMNFSASEGKRTLMVMSMMQGSQNQVNVNWGE